ncbi:hypothetical protein AVEN_55511-1 [Araneus ventricosus]|uniref:Uncharacterized protein n=1 Tax=Araneus ventricosus TaxID=182803 RepID=A0A4Y2CB15_ARAVE|nr:hypothetical protein AVEN_55511-1 [Araneus ventricosus]
MKEDTEEPLLTSQSLTILELYSISKNPGKQTWIITLENFLYSGHFPSRSIGLKCDIPYQILPIPIPKMFPVCLKCQCVRASPARILGVLKCLLLSPGDLFSETLLEFCVGKRSHGFDLARSGDKQQHQVRPTSSNEQLAGRDMRYCSP